MTTSQKSERQEKEGKKARDLILASAAESCRSVASNETRSQSSLYNRNSLTESLPFGVDGNSIKCTTIDAEVGGFAQPKGQSNAVHRLGC